MHTILEELAVGEYDEAVTPPPGITALLCVAAERSLSSSRIPYHRVPMEGGQAIPGRQLLEAAEWIHLMALSGRRILLFSSRGESRAPSVAVAYLCLKQGLAFGQALETVARVMPSLQLAPGLVGSIEEALSLG